MSTPVKAISLFCVAYACAGLPYCAIALAGTGVAQIPVWAQIGSIALGTVLSLLGVFLGVKTALSWPVRGI